MKHKGIHNIFDWWLKKEKSKKEEGWQSPKANQQSKRVETLFLTENIYVMWSDAGGEQIRDKSN